MGLTAEGLDRTGLSSSLPACQHADHAVRVGHVRVDDVKQTTRGMTQRQ